MLESQPLLVADAVLLGIRKCGKFLASAPLLSKIEPPALRAAEMRACFAMRALQYQPPSIFPRTASDKDKYSFIIPLALTLCAEIHGHVASVSVLYEMMVLSILNFHVDEYMEGVVEKHFREDLDTIRHLVSQLFTEFRPGTHSCVANSDGKGTEATRQDSKGLKPRGAIRTSVIVLGVDLRWIVFDWCYVGSWNIFCTIQQFYQVWPAFRRN